MENVTAEYILKEDGTIQVINSGWKDGEKKVAEGKAKCPDPVGNPAHLRVSFFLFFYSDYNILYVDDARQILLDEAARRGYDLSGLIWVNHTL